MAAAGAIQRGNLLSRRPRANRPSRRMRRNYRVAASDDPLTDGGTVEAAFIFHRHGDRAPNRYLGDPSHLSSESEHWYGRIPHCFSRAPPHGGEARANLSERFPPRVHPSQNGGRHLDVDREPFGFLTYRGMDQMRDAGGRFRRRYERFGHRVEGVGGGRGGERYSLLDHWDVRAYSTNYLRTVMSVQCFLDGLIGKCPRGQVADHTNTNDNDGQNRVFAGGGLKRYFKDVGRRERLAHSDASTWTAVEDMANAEGKSIQVLVRDKAIDTLNAFDRHPRMMDDLVKDVIATERFQRIDGGAKPLADTLIDFLPGLRGAPQAFGGTPSGINWIHANDHFVCRAAHSVPLLAFSDHEGRIDEAEVEADLARLAAPVRAHLAWRFREWYRCPRLLSAVACPPFAEIMGVMRGAATGLGPRDRRPLVLYSCHDVTLLALLYAIGADFLVSGDDCGGARMGEEGSESLTHSGMNGGSISAKKHLTSWRWWPPYSSTIAFELVRLGEGERRLTDELHVIRVILNGETVRTIPRMSAHDEGMLDEQPLSSRKVFGEMGFDDKRCMMKISDFEQLIRVLEETGNFSSVEDNNLKAELGPIDKIGVDGG